MSASGALIVGALGLAAAPYLARLTLSVPDRSESRWWRGRDVTKRRLAATAAFALGFGLLGGAAAGVTSLLPAFVLYTLACAPLAVIDVELHRLPDRLVFLLAGGAAVLLAVAAAQQREWSHLVRAAEGAAAVYAVLYALRLIAPSGFGYGDVKLGGIVAGYLGWFGWVQVFYGVFAGFLLGSFVSIGAMLSGRANRKTAIPFGPMLMLGPLLVLAFDLVPPSLG